MANFREFVKKKTIFKKHPVVVFFLQCPIAMKTAHIISKFAQPLSRAIFSELPLLFQWKCFSSLAMTCSPPQEKLAQNGGFSGCGAQHNKMAPIFIAVGDNQECFNSFIYT